MSDDSEARIGIEHPVIRIKATTEKPRDYQEVLILIDHEVGGEPDTWYGQMRDGEWFGNAGDDEGWQPLYGKIIGWIPLPKLST